MTLFGASGKLVVLGEYAVVDGGTALVSAVAHGVECEVHPHPQRLIETPDGDDRFARAALDAVNAPAGRYVFRGRHPLQTSEKPGFGGSAAAVVAGLRAGGFEGDASALTRLGITVHRAVQGSGSGVDVAAAAFGSGLRFQDGSASPVALPEPVVVYAGKSAKTGPRIATWNTWTGRAQFVEDSNGWVEAFHSDPVRVTRTAWRGLCAMAREAGILYQTPAIDTIVAEAEALGGAAKPSGAGGGDSVIAFVDDRARFQARLTVHGIAVLPVVFERG